MRPNSSMYNIAYGGSGDAIRSCEIGLSDTLGVLSPDRKSVRLVQFCVSMTRSASHHFWTLACVMFIAYRPAFRVFSSAYLIPGGLPSLSAHISVVVYGGSKKQVGGITAGRIVAMVQYAQLSGIGSTEQEECYTMSAEIFLLTVYHDAELTVAPFVRRVFPFPAIARSTHSNLTLEALNVLRLKWWHIMIRDSHDLNLRYRLGLRRGLGGVIASSQAVSILSQEVIA